MAMGKPSVTIKKQIAHYSCIVLAISHGSDHTQWPLGLPPPAHLVRLHGGQCPQHERALTSP